MNWPNWKFPNPLQRHVLSITDIDPSVIFSHIQLSVSISRGPSQAKDIKRKNSPCIEWGRLVDLVRHLRWEHLQLSRADQHQIDAFNKQYFCSHPPMSISEGPSGDGGNISSSAGLQQAQLGHQVPLQRNRHSSMDTNVFELHAPLMDAWIAVVSVGGHFTIWDRESSSESS